jgi:flavin reductase (DIM6/NTAB) family NADH-FMN oxidoreductase RutF
MTPPPLPADFRAVAGRFATGVTVITTVVDGVDHAMTMNSFTSVSLEPLLVMVSIEKIARFHDLVLGAGTWAVSILGEDAQEASAWFAKRGRPLEGQLEGWKHYRGPETGSAIFSDAIGAIECRTHAVHVAGDHTLVVGEVLSLASPAENAPLIYYNGGYRRLTDSL